MSDMCRTPIRMGHNRGPRVPIRHTMLNPDRVYMLAADHRWQWEEWCDTRSIPRTRIRDAKRLAFDGFLRAQTPISRGPRLRRLVDRRTVRIGRHRRRTARRHRRRHSRRESRRLPAHLVHGSIRTRAHRRVREGAASGTGRITKRQCAKSSSRKLAALQTWCRQERKPFVVEILVPRQGEPEGEFETSGRPAIIAALIRDASRRGLTPEFWKIEGTLAPDGARAIDAAIAEDPRGRQIILGKAADLATIGLWFKAAAQSRTAAGFAIGRSVFWEPSAAFLAGTQTADQAADTICNNYLHLIAAWEERSNTLEPSPR